MQKLLEWVVSEMHTFDCLILLINKNKTRYMYIYMHPKFLIFNEVRVLYLF